MKKTLTASLLALMMTASLCACGTDDDTAKAQPDTAASSAATTITTTAAAETTAQTAAESKSADYMQKPSADDEAATVQYLADTYFKAVEKKDYETLADIVAVDLMCYVEDGDTGDRNAHLEAVKSLCSSSDQTAAMEIGKPQKESGYVSEYNKFFKMMDEESGESELAKKFKVEDAYTVNYKTGGKGDFDTKTDKTDSGISVDISGSYDVNMDIDMPIIKINGEWKCEPSVHMIMALMNAFS